MLILITLNFIFIAFIAGPVIPIRITASGIARIILSCLTTFESSVTCLGTGSPILGIRTHVPRASEVVFFIPGIGQTGKSIQRTLVLRRRPCRESILGFQILDQLAGQ